MITQQFCLWLWGFHRLSWLLWGWLAFWSILSYGDHRMFCLSVLRCFLLRLRIFDHYFHYCIMGVCMYNYVQHVCGYVCIQYMQY